MLLFLLGVLVVGVGLALSIALHEIGHLVPAKVFGVRVTQYMVGFGPTILSRTRGETEYGIKAIPLGGYIRMIGMYPPHKGDPEGSIREDSTGKKSIHELNLNDADIINSPYFYLQQNDVLYVTPNRTKAKNSDIGTSTSYWVSSISILVSIASLVTNILRN